MPDAAIKYTVFILFQELFHECEELFEDSDGTFLIRRK